MIERMLSKIEYEEATARTRDERMAWWREARFGMFIHYGLYSQLGRGEWAQVCENIPPEEYAQLADSFTYRRGAAREWAQLAKKVGMKYMVLTTRHHEGFSLWDSKVNPFNSVNYGPHCDIVQEFVDACREYDLKVGFYYSLMDWHHPDGWRCAVDRQARERFLQYTDDLTQELFSKYGKIDILWYDGNAPMRNWEGWDSVARNQRIRDLQPQILINNRSCLTEDFVTPEEHLSEKEEDWESCMTFGGLTWGYLDPEQMAPYNYSAQQILRMLAKVTYGGGNLLLNIGPAPDGSVPSDVVKPLLQVGEWLERNGESIYGKKCRQPWQDRAAGNMVTGPTEDKDGKTVYLHMKIWPHNGSMGITGMMSKPISATFLTTGEPVEFEHKGQRLIFKNLPEKSPDPLNVTVIKLTFDHPQKSRSFSYYPQLLQGQMFTEELL